MCVIFERGVPVAANTTTIARTSDGITILAQLSRIHGIEMWLAVPLDKSGKPQPEYTAMRYSEQGARRECEKLMNAAIKTVERPPTE